MSSMARGFVLVLLLLCILGCHRSRNFAGTWNIRIEGLSRTSPIVFNPDGTLVIEGGGQGGNDGGIKTRIEGRWHAVGDELYMMLLTIKATDPSGQPTAESENAEKAMKANYPLRQEYQQKTTWTSDNEFTSDNNGLVTTYTRG